MNTKKLFFVVNILFSFIYFAACRSGNNQDTTTTQSLVNSGHGWPGGVVRACFINGNQYPQAAQMVRTAVTSNFIKSNVGIEFTGWGDCKDTPSAEARVWFGVERAYSYYIGKLKIGDANPMDHQSLTIGLPTPGNNEFYDYNTALHEFGHFAGLFHEQARLENLNGGACTRQETGPLGYPDFIKPSMQPIAGFDFGSIMNYCVQGYQSRHLMLSQSDIQGLRYLYGLSSSIISPDNSQNPATLCNKMEIAPISETFMSHKLKNIYSNDFSKVTAYSDERRSKVSGWIDVGTKVSRLKTYQTEATIGFEAESITMMLVIPDAGILTNQQVWIWGNVTKEIGCRNGSNVSNRIPSTPSSVDPSSLPSTSGISTPNYGSVFSSPSPTFTNSSGFYSSSTLPDYSSTFSSTSPAFTNSSSFYNGSTLPDWSSSFSYTPTFTNSSGFNSNSTLPSVYSPTSSSVTGSSATCQRDQLNICLKYLGGDACYPKWGCIK